MAAQVNDEKCIGCEACVSACPNEAITVNDGVAKVDEDACIDGGICVDECTSEAISL